MFESAAILIVTNDFYHCQEKSVSKLCSFLVLELKSLNCKVQKVTFVDEDDGIVAHELNFLSRQFDIVLVTGDLKKSVIYKALGTICCEELVKNTKFSNSITNGFSESSSGNLLPPQAKFLICDSLSYPIIYLQRIFILNEDCVEILFLKLLKQHLQQYCQIPKFTKKFNIYINNVIDLDKIGSMAAVTLKQENDHIVISIENEDFDKFIEIENILKNKFFNIEEICDNGMLERIYESQEEHIQQSIHHIVKCFETYGPDNVFLSFNGGKDCTVLLHLVFIVLKIKYPEYKRPIFCMYVRYQDVFPEQDKFVAQCQIYYNLEVFTLSLSIKQALEKVLQMKPNLKACFMGTRRTDPYSSSLNIFQLTDPSWPKIMRVSPLLEWHYTDIWDYLLFHKIPYCELYDLGYTSLGSARNTVKNSSLLFYDVKLRKNIYLPAYKMLNEAEERTGREPQR